ncbi:nitroreductase family protein [Candidatus Contubernalis alkalaceticus]|nr:nitroreductase family protein [Candidatus Contubernalis alkalaceticus]
MELMEAIQKRHSIRNFKEDEIAQEDLKKILEAACLAPTAGNMQAWRFVVVKNKKIKRDLGISALNQMWMSKAPLILVICADMARAERFYGERGKNLYALQDTAAAAQNILLTAVSLGMGGCWVGAFSEPRVSKILDLSHWVRPLAMLPIGFTDEEVKSSSRLKPEELTQYID